MYNMFLTSNVFKFLINNVEDNIDVSMISNVFKFFINYVEDNIDVSDFKISSKQKMHNSLLLGNHK